MIWKRQPKSTSKDTEKSEESVMGGCAGPRFVRLFSIPPGAGQIRSRPSFLLLGTGWHQPDPKQLFQHQWGKPHAHPNRARSGNEVICFPYSAGKLLPQGKAI